MREFASMLAAILFWQAAWAQPYMTSEQLSFEVAGNTLEGRLDLPIDGDAEALVIFVHGYGPTNVIEQNWYWDLRARFATLGVASFTWDKPGSGLSEGTFDIDQPVEDSAAEVLAAATMLRKRGVPGAERIGFWGISRAGWIVPLAMAQDSGFAFWISVSGTDDKESFGYLLRSNWRIMGYSDDQIERLYEGWLASVRLTADGAPYADYQAATAAYYRDPLVQRFAGPMPSKAGYEAVVSAWRQNPPVIDPDTGLVVYVEGFRDILNKVDAPVLAIFGEKDMSVDWRATKSLYEATLGEDPDSDLTVLTFPDGNHNLHVAETGGYDEMLRIIGEGHEMVPGYYEALMDFIQKVKSAE